MERKTKIIIFILFLIWLLLFIPNAKAQAPKPEVSLDIRDQSIKEIVNYFAIENDLDPKLALAVMRCESNGKQNTISDGGRSIGVFQYQKPTWERHSKEYGEELDRNSPYDQAKLATWAIANGKGREWSSYRSLKNGGTYSFYSNQLKQHFTVKCSM